MCNEPEKEQALRIELRGWRYAAYLLYQLDEVRKNREMRPANNESERSGSEPRKKLLSSTDLADKEKGRNGSEG